MSFTLRKDNHEWWKVTFILGNGLAGSGLLTLAVAFAGWPSASFYIWRATAIICLLLGPIIFTRMVIMRRGDIPASTLGRGGPPGSEAEVRRYGPLLWSTVTGTSIMAAIAWLSFQSHPLVTMPDALGASAAVEATSTLTVASILLIGTLIVLGFGIMYFLSLFSQRLQQGGAPQLESHWGGIGGGLGGWRMSQSLGYLLVATALAILFTVFLLRFSASEQGQDKPGSTPTPSATPKTAEARKEAAADSVEKAPPH